jgi:hypothetical protein
MDVIIGPVIYATWRKTKSFANCAILKVGPQRRATYESRTNHIRPLAGRAGAEAPSERRVTPGGSYDYVSL